jgi:hypothetical protein
MKKLIEFGCKMPVSGRIYEKGNIIIPKNKKTDIIILSSNWSKWESFEEHKKIGEAEIIENEIGIFAKEIEYFIDLESLEKLQDSFIKTMIDKYDEEIYYTKDLCAGLFINGSNKGPIYSRGSIELKFLYHDIFNYKRSDIDEIIREIKISLLLND